MRRCAFLLNVMMLALSTVLSVWAQTMPCAADQGKPPDHGPFRTAPRGEADDSCNATIQNREQPARTQLSRDRYVQLDKDTSELLRLADELKRLVAQSNQQILSVEIASKAERIEKISKRIKNKMRHGY